MVWQVAISLVLLIGAGLMRSVIKLQQVDPGFVPNRVLALTIDRNWSKYPGDPERRDFANGLLAKPAGLSALALPRWMRSLLFEVEPADPLNFAGVSIVLAAVALMACYLPARRALRIDL